VANHFYNFLIQMGGEKRYALERNTTPEGWAKMNKILPILGLVGRVIAILLLIGMIVTLGYTTYYYVAPLSAPRPVDMEAISHKIYMMMLPYQRGVPAQAAPAQASPTPISTGDAPTAPPSDGTPTGGAAWVFPGAGLA
jgi:hypothetical protein